MQEVAREFGILEPADLVDLVARGAGDPSIGAGPERAVGELSEGVAAVGRAVDNVAGDEFPAVVVGGVDLGVRALEEGDVGLEPIKIAIRPEALCFELFSLVE